MCGENNFSCAGGTESGVGQGRDGEERGAIAWLRLGGWMAHHLRNESDIRLCPLCNEQDSWEHIVANCPETELLRWQLLPERFLRSECGRLACWDLIWGYESGNGICKYLVKVRKIRGEKIRAQIG